VSKPGRNWNYEGFEGMSRHQVMNALGEEGWELVAVESTHRPSGGDDFSLYFKRPRPEA